MSADLSRRAGWRDSIFVTGRALLVDEPSFVAWQMLLTLFPYSLKRFVGGAHTDSSESGFQPTFGPAAQLAVFHLVASMSSAAIDRIPGMWRLYELGWSARASLKYQQFEVANDKRCHY
ncbi:hypothetical protein ACVILL_000763 [Bradyrhizobium sp. USDA 3364]